MTDISKDRSSNERILEIEIFDAIFTAGAVRLDDGRYYWNDSELAGKLKRIHADPVKYAAYLANDLKTIFGDEVTIVAEPDPDYFDNQGM